MPQWRDIDVLLRRKRDGDIMEMSEIDAIMNSLNNIFSTSPGTRRMLPDFARTTNKLLFEPMDQKTANTLRNELFSALIKWENRINIKSLTLKADYDNNAYILDLIFSVKSTDNHLFSFTKILEAK